MEPARHCPVTPSSLDRQQVQRDLRGIPKKHFPIWGKTLGHGRGQVQFLLLPEFCEQGLLIPTPEGYTYRIEKRIECPNIYCNRYMNAMQTRSPSTGHAEAGASPYEISNQGHYVPGLSHPGGQLGEIPPYTMANPDYFQQLELYNAMSLVLEYPVIEEHTYHSTVPQHSMDTASDSTSGLDLHSPPNPPWDSDIYDQVHPYGHRWTDDPSPPPPRG